MNLSLIVVSLSVSALGVCHAQSGASRSLRTVVTAPHPRAQLPWQIESTPRLVIGGGEDSEREPFDNIRGVVRLNSGKLVVANMGASLLQFFEPDGRYSKSAGRKGAGPGEFQQLFALFLGPADSLMAYDVMQGFHVFDPLGRHVRTITYGRDSPTPFRVWPYGWFADGSQLVAQRPTRRDQAKGRWIDSMTFYRADQNGQLRGELFRYPSFELVAGGRFGPMPVAFGPTISVAVWPERYCVGFADRYEIACGAEGAAPTLLIRHPVPSVAVSARSVERFKELTRALPMEGGGPVPEKLKSQREALLETRVFASRQPYFSRFVGASTGELWVQRYQIEEGMPRSDFRQETPRAATTWDVFSPSGEWLAIVSLPGQFRPYQIGADYVLGVRLDRDDVEQVVVFGLRR